MRLQAKPLGFIVNFMLGIAWASMLIGAVTSFLSFYSDSLAFAIVSAGIASLPGMVVVLLLEHFITSKEKLAELQKQTKLLEALQAQGSRP